MFLKGGVVASGELVAQLRVTVEEGGVREVASLWVQAAPYGLHQSAQRLRALTCVVLRGVRLIRLALLALCRRVAARAPAHARQGQRRTQSPAARDRLALLRGERLAPSPLVLLRAHAFIVCGAHVPLDARELAPNRLQTALRLVLAGED